MINRQKKIIVFLQPEIGFIVLAFGAVPITARVITVFILITFRAIVKLAAHIGSSALENIIKSLSMTRQHSGRIFSKIRTAVLFEYVGYFSQGA
jgi:hypothetical protein